MTKKQRVIATISIFMCLLPFAFWFGEAGKSIFQINPYLTGIIGCLLVSIISAQKKKLKLFNGISFIGLFALFFYLGNVSFYKTYNNCIDDAEIIRGDLKSYFQKNGSYPDSLDQLNSSIPCQRVTRGSLLEYTLTESGYNLSFRDWLVEYSATESEEFLSHK